jgi:exodeoxyribonuclease V alpha subunit
VICVKNGFYPLADDGNKTQTSDDAMLDAHGRAYVANGDIGRVLHCESNFMDVQLSGPVRYVRVPRSKSKDSKDDDEDDDAATGTGCNWGLAYALTVHKMQGSEVPVSIVIVDEAPGAKRLCNRAWVYTAISRAKKACFLVGSLATARGFCSRNTIAARKTFLRELING